MNGALLLWGHALAALLCGMLGLAELRKGAGRTWGLGRWPHRAFVTALFATGLWALAVAGIGADAVAARIAESVRDIAWLGFMLAVVRQDRSGSVGLGAVYLVVILIAVASAVLAVAPAASVHAGAAAGLEPGLESVRLMFRTMTAVSALVLVHHLFQAAPASRGGVRLVVLALATMWCVDLIVYTAWYVQGEASAGLLIGRGAAMTGVAALLAIAVHKGGNWTLALSRPIALRALSAIALVLYAGVTALVASISGSIAAGYAGAAARIVQTGIVIGATAALFALLTTPWWRAWTKVTVAKHLFRHRYDYRAEWLRFTDTLGKPETGVGALEMRVVKSIADLADSPGGLLLVADEGALVPAATWNWGGPVDLPADDALAHHLAGDARAGAARIVELDRVRAGTAPADERACVPDWLREHADAWAIVPLLHGALLVGAIVLARPPVGRALDWEDFDLFRVAGRQAASYLAEDRAHAALADAARFDEFNRRFAFILHDIKNLVSQLTLVARNAERHADNPAFRVDMVATLKESSDRMNALLARLSQHGSVRAEPLGPIDVAGLVERVVAGRRTQHPIAARTTVAVARGHAARLEQVLGHLVQNAIEASDDDAAILVSVEPCGDRVAIEVVDRGCGMTPGFVRDHLFRPFVSSKPTGFGIGAFEARQLAQAMGGTLAVTSREGEGTRFRILLPREAALEVAA